MGSFPIKMQEMTHNEVNCYSEVAKNKKKTSSLSMISEAKIPEDIQLRLDKKFMQKQKFLWPIQNRVSDKKSKKVQNLHRPYVEQCQKDLDLKVACFGQSQQIISPYSCTIYRTRVLRSY